MWFPSRTTPPGTPKIKNPPKYPTKELWGPIPKEYGTFLGGRSWAVPGKVDGVPILTKCSEIGPYMKEQLGSTLIFLKKDPPACWEDDASIITGLRGADPEYYYVSVGDRRFYQGVAGFQEPTFGVSNNTPIGSFFKTLGLRGGRKTSHTKRNYKKYKKDKKRTTRRSNN
jgi:hypothetical protein